MIAYDTLPVLGNTGCVYMACMWHMQTWHIVHSRVQDLVFGDG
jgi:hypothetical protein